MKEIINKKKIACVGYGYVGKGVERFFKDHYEVLFYDPNVEGSATKEEINACDLAVICTPTAMKEDGSVDISIVEETVKWLETPVILIKSTIPPNTTDYLVKTYNKKIAFSPEYMGEGKYQVYWWKDRGYPHPTEMKFHDFQIFGGERETTSAILEFFKRVMGPEPRLMQTNAKTAEMVKYMENSWGAMKVIFCNEWAKMAENYGVDYDELRELWLLDGRVERMHTAVFKESRGFGGKCFPKDVTGIVKHSTDSGYTPKLLKMALEVNEDLQK